MDFDFDELEQEDAPKTPEEELLDYIEGAVAELKSRARQLEATIEQSNNQVEQARQRNMTVMAALQRIEGTLDQTPRVNIKEAYTEALNIQQRLLTSQSQLERLREQKAFLDEEISLLTNVRQQFEQLGSQEDDQQFNTREMLRRVIDAQETERDELARRLHDGPAHALTNFILQAEICQMLFDRDEAKARQELDDLKSKASDAFRRVRSFIFDLRPMMLTDLGLVPTMDRYVENFQEKSGVEVQYEAPAGSSRRLEDYREVLVFRGIQAIMTKARDGGATSIRVVMDLDATKVRASVEDNGRGLGTGELSLNPEKPEALGLGTLQERIHLVGGTLEVQTIAGGTRIEFEIPAGPEPNENVAYDQLV